MSKLWVLFYGIVTGTLLEVVVKVLGMPSAVLLCVAFAGIYGYLCCLQERLNR